MLSTLDFTLGFTQEEKPQLGTQCGQGDAGGSPPLQAPSIQPGATFTLGMSWALRVHTQPSPLLMAAPGVSPPGTALQPLTLNQAALLSCSLSTAMSSCSSLQLCFVSTTLNNCVLEAMALHCSLAFHLI